MNTTPKINQCITVLKNSRRIIETRVNPDQAFFVDLVLNTQKELISIFKYRLLPIMGTIVVGDKVKKEAARKNPLLANVPDFDLFWIAVEKCELITTRDLEDEYWSVCKDLDNIIKTIDFFNKKFDDVNFVYYTNLDAIRENLGDLTRITKEEADILCLNTQTLAIAYNSTLEQIRNIFKGLRKFTTIEENKRERIKPLGKEKAKHGALAHIFDCEFLKSPIVKGDNKRLELQAIGRRKYGGSGDHFYRTVKDMVDERVIYNPVALKGLGGDWKEWVLFLTKNDPTDMEEFLKSRGL